MRVLAIGINEYLDLNSLHSCVNDALDINDFFLKKVNLDKKKVACLTSFQKTKKSNILRYFQEFIKNIEEGETGYFFYSAHGGIFRINEGTNEEVFEGVYTSDSVIYEFELQDILEKFLKDNAKLVSVLDTCHSGGVDILSFLKLNTELEIKTPVNKNNNDFVKKPKTKFLEPLKENRLTFAACGVEELAYGDMFKGRMNGVFTYHFLQKLNSNPKMSYVKMFEHLANRLPNEAREHLQTPQLRISKKYQNSIIIN